jgi:TatD DNase family protein
VVVHCRDAIEDCLGILDEWGRDDVPIVFHCFSGGTSEAKLLIERGYFVSFTGVLTFVNARETQKAAQYVPLEMTMLETDCPYLSPEPQRNIRPNEPALLIHIAEKLAQLRGENVEEIAEVTGQNSRLFFGID